MPAREVYWAEMKKSVPTEVYDGERLLPGNRLPGPAVIETADTTVVVRPGQAVRVDGFGNFEFNLQG